MIRTQETIGDYYKNMRKDLAKSKYTIYRTGCLEGSWSEDVVSLLRLCDNDFIPSLSSRPDGQLSNSNSNGSIEEYFKSIENQKFILAVNKETNRVIGFLSYKPNHVISVNGNTYTGDYISTVIVHPDDRCCGIAEQLYRSMLNRRPQSILVRTWSSNNVQLHILGVLGFKVLETIDNDRGENIDTLYLGKELTMDYSNNRLDRILQAGRLANPINLDSLADEWKRNIMSKISMMKGNIVALDWDGTCTEFKYAKDTLLPCREDELYEYSKTGNIYENVHLLKMMMYIVSELDVEDVYIVTSTRSTLIGKKDSCIGPAYPEIPASHIIHTNNSAEKVGVLKQLYEKHRKKIIFVEDTASTIQLVDEDPTIDYVYGIHISSFLV